MNFSISQELSERMTSNKKKRNYQIGYIRVLHANAADPHHYFCSPRYDVKNETISKYETNKKDTISHFDISLKQNVDRRHSIATPSEYCKKLPSSKLLARRSTCASIFEHTHHWNSPSYKTSAEAHGKDRTHKVTNTVSGKKCKRISGRKSSPDHDTLLSSQAFNLIEISELDTKRETKKTSLNPPTSSVSKLLPTENSTLIDFKTIRKKEVKETENLLTRIQELKIELKVVRKALVGPMEVIKHPYLTDRELTFNRMKSKKY